MEQPIDRQAFRLIHRLRVRWAEVDQQRIVFNPHYLMYIDTAFTEYWRALGIPYDVIPQLLGGDLYVRKSTLEYHGSARLDDLLDVGIRCERIGTTSLLFQGGVFRDDHLLVSADMVYVFADPATQSATPVPQNLRDLIQSYEAGASSIEVRVGSWDMVEQAARNLRREVFLDELKLDAAMDHDDADITAIHALVHNRMGQPLATARLTREGAGVARIARVAVSRAMRSTGCGRVLMDALMLLASERGDTRIVISSQCSAEGFYARMGFVPIGEPYVAAGVPHIDMARRLGGVT